MSERWSPADVVTVTGGVMTHGATLTGKVLRLGDGTSTVTNIELPRGASVEADRLMALPSPKPGVFIRLRDAHLLNCEELFVMGRGLCQENTEETLVFVEPGQVVCYLYDGKRYEIECSLSGRLLCSELQVTLRY